MCGRLTVSVPEIRVNEGRRALAFPLRQGAVIRDAHNLAIPAIRAHSCGCDQCNPGR
jgi:hypothetical protein